MSKPHYGMNWIRGRKRLAIYIADGWRCFYCHREMRDAAPNTANSPTLDHLLPRSAGGTNAADNLVMCCRSCNSTRGDMYLSDWYRQPTRGDKRYASKQFGDRCAAIAFEYAAGRVLNFDLVDAILNATEDQPPVDDDQPLVNK